MSEQESVLLPVIPLRDVVAFPDTLVPLYVFRAPSLAALEAAEEKDKRLFLVAQKSFEVEDPTQEDLYTYGTIVEIIQQVRMPDGSARVMAQGQAVARCDSYVERDDYLSALVSTEARQYAPDKRLEALARALRTQFERYVSMARNVPDEAFLTVRSIADPHHLANTVANHAQIAIEDKQQILEESNAHKRLSVLTRLLAHENEMLDLEGKILDQVKTQIGKNQKEYFLNEQMRAIERELGVDGESDSDLEELGEQIEASGMTEEANEKATKELTRLSHMQPMSPEATVSRTYIEWLVEVPWREQTEDMLDLDRAQRILDEDHYGLKRVKERVIEYLAVLKLKRQIKGPILCLVGPPGVGKSSLARSIARALDRKFVRVSLGGVRDEAEIRGHRRTYIGSLPGKVLQSMKKAGTINPVILFDEIDKMSHDFRGDPSSAMLEVLDPEQNMAFNDHYLEVDYNLSNVLFITTANSTDGCPPPLLDRMEVLRISGYTEDEKRKIATQFLIPKQIVNNGLDPKQVTFQESALNTIILNYTREAGVRNLEREIASICRKIARQIVQKKRKTRRVSVSPKRVRDALGPVRYQDMEPHEGGEIGVVMGLAWTEAGGELLPIETIVMEGKGELSLTGQLGEVMQESAKAALSYVRAHCREYGIEPDFKGKCDLHIHIPEGSIPKDGPSAGVSMATSLVSALSKRPVRRDVAMTGELTLRGRVLKIGALKEKALAAHRVRIQYVIIPYDNLGDLQEIDEEIRSQLKFIPVKTLADVLKVALVPEAKPTKKGAKGRAPTRGKRPGAKKSPKRKPARSSDYAHL